MISDDLRHVLEEKLSIEIVHTQSVSGGDIHDAFRLETKDGQTLFMKGNSIERAWEMLHTEALGLQRIDRVHAAPVPEIIDCGRLDRYAYLILTFIEEGNPTRQDWEAFAQALGSLHRAGELPFGLEHDNFIGRLDQKNARSEEWPAFYRDQRIGPQIEMMKQAFPSETQFYRDAETLLGKMDVLVEDAEPSLIHGDLWGGNYHASEHNGIYLIDPAVSIASREMDIAMSRLFGGFPDIFYEAYQSHYPLEHGWEDRIPLYQLYYLLVHVNLFGRSYIPGAHRAIRRYVR